MSLLVDRQELAGEYFVALERVVDCIRLEEHSKGYTSPVTVPLTESGEMLSIMTHNTGDFLEGDGKLRLEYCVPRDVIDDGEVESLDYAREVHDSEALDLLHETIEDVFDEDSISFMVRDATCRTLTFATHVSVTDPTMLPVDDDHEIVPVIEVSVEKNWLYKRANRNTVQRAMGEETDMVIHPSDGEVEAEFDEAVTVFGQELEVAKRDGEVVLEKDGTVYGYVGGLDGDWLEMVDADGEYEIESLF